MRFASALRRRTPPSIAIEDSIRACRDILDSSRTSDILYLGDSVVLRVADQDQDRRPLGHMVADACDPLRVRWIAQTAFHPSIHRVLLDIDHGRSKRVLVAVNLRCFSAQWHAHPVWRHDELLAWLRLGGRAAPPRRRKQSRAAMKRYRATDLAVPVLPGSTIRDLDVMRERSPLDLRERNARTAMLLAAHYGYTLRSSHPWVIALLDMVRDTHTSGVSLALYLTPINVQAVDRHAGPGVRERIESNRQLLGQLVHGIGGTLHDFADLLPSDAFFHVNDTTEHLAEGGRRQLATRLVSVLAELR